MKSIFNLFIVLDINVLILFLFAKLNNIDERGITFNNINGLYHKDISNKCHLAIISIILIKGSNIILLNNLNKYHHLNEETLNLTKSKY